MPTRRTTTLHDLVTFKSPPLPFALTGSMPTVLVHQNQFSVHATYTHSNLVTLMGYQVHLASRSKYKKINDKIADLNKKFLFF